MVVFVFQRLFDFELNVRPNKYQSSSTYKNTLILKNVNNTLTLIILARRSFDVLV